MTDDGYLTREQLAAYATVSERQLQIWTNWPTPAALPCYRFGKRAVRYKRAEFDAWFAQYRMRGKPDLVHHLRALGLDPARVPDTRKPLARAGAAPAPRSAHAVHTRTGGAR
jgi:hypothetical protein